MRAAGICCNEPSLEIELTQAKTNNAVTISVMVELLAACKGGPLGTVFLFSVDAGGTET